MSTAWALLTIWLAAATGQPVAGAPSPAAARPIAADFTAAQAVLEAAIDERVFPGCAVMVGTSDKTLWTAEFGALDETGAQRPTATTLYDLASLTKVVSTTLVILKLVERGDLDVQDHVHALLPGFARKGATARERRWRRTIRVEHLLRHNAGFPAWRPLYRRGRGLSGIVAAAAAVPLASRPGVKTLYSDLDFILLGAIAAKVGGAPLAELERSLLFAPLGMGDTVRAPADSAVIAPTTKRQRGGYLRGVVHDRNARAAHGLTGHAGLFSTTRDLGRLARELLRALADRGAVIKGEPLRTFTTRGDSTFALGWDTPSADGSAAGSRLSTAAFGHTGFTGTSLWIDPQRDLYVVLLSNRVHPKSTRAGKRAMYRVRRAFQDAVVDAVDRARG
ncbi:MAG: beta-lactamase family protein [Myxococcales bacterium]|nr:beta-lactamase family protein [Myxococcales bacterium]